MLRNDTKLLHKELSYLIQGCAFEIRKRYGAGHKENVYKNLMADFIHEKGLRVEKEKGIPVFSDKSGKIVGKYQPDLVVDGKIILELKASKLTTLQDIRQLDYYLKNSVYELGYLVNFGTPHLFIKRRIYTNDRKHFRVLS